MPEPGAEQESAGARGRVEVSRQPDGHWRWRWSDGSGHELVSHRAYDSLDEATSSAEEAYPDLDVLTPAQDAHDEASGRRWRRWLLLATVAAAVVLVARRPGRT